ncbi:MAG: hypothetical protein OXN25_10285 [Candidatus Poribacteria bacterium]|nr:hypothetical protein [Candidatus Poribacteria bacterium]
MLNREHANVFLRYWKQALGKPLGVIDMEGPCNKARFGDLVNFSEYARYYIGSDMLNGGYSMDDWTYEKHKETNYDRQYHNLFAENQTGASRRSETCAARRENKWRVLSKSAITAGDFSATRKMLIRK